MAASKTSKSAASGTKFEEVVGLGSESLSEKNNVRYPLCECAQNFFSKLGDILDIKRWKTELSKYTPEEQEEIIDLAGEVAYEPRVSAFIPIERDLNYCCLVSHLAECINEYEEEQRYKAIYER